MKKYLTILTFIVFLFYNSLLKAEDALTVKQQLDRIKEEVKDLNKAVFNKSFNNNEIDLNKKENDTERFTSIDVRMYDLEKDIKNLTLQFEEILFKLDDLSNEIVATESKLITKIDKLKNNSENHNNQIKIEENSNSSLIAENNKLGELIISDNNNISKNLTDEELSKVELEETKEDAEYIKLPPEEQLQFALDQMIKKNYLYSKEILENFVKSFPENQLSGSAHFWLGKIHLFEKDFRKAAIVFGEGIQKFPNSIKAAEMYYELAKSLKEMKKIPEACKTLSLLEEQHKNSKFIKDPENIKADITCNQ